MSMNFRNRREQGGQAVGMLARLLQTLPPELRTRLDAIWTERRCEAGDVLVEEDQDGGQIGYVIDGHLGMVKRLPDGRRHIIGFLAPTDMYGRAFGGASGYRVEALADTLVQTCDRARFEEILGCSPEAEHLFLVNVLDELDAAREWVIVMGGTKTVQRLAAFLLTLIRRKRRWHNSASPEGPPINLHLAIKRRDLADYLGARPESLSRAFHELARDGVIRINDPFDVDVLDLTALIDVAGQDLVMDEDV